MSAVQKKYCMQHVCKAPIFTHMIHKFTFVKKDSLLHTCCMNNYFAFFSKILRSNFVHLPYTLLFYLQAEIRTGGLGVLNA